jgi:hypothetical protein
VNINGNVPKAPQPKLEVRVVAGQLLQGEAASKEGAQSFFVAKGGLKRKGFLCTKALTTF